VYTSWFGVLKSSIPSRKNGRFSAKNSANRSFTVTRLASDSTWEKSGLTVASRVTDGSATLRFTPASGLMSSRSKVPVGVRAPFNCAVTNGCTSVVIPRSMCSMPVREPPSLRKLAVARRASVHVSSKPVACTSRTTLILHVCGSLDGNRRLLNGMRSSTT
jgi:hypothetical protein